MIIFRKTNEVMGRFHVDGGVRMTDKRQGGRTCVVAVLDGINDFPGVPTSGTEHTQGIRRKLFVTLQDKFCCLNRMDRQLGQLSGNELDGQKMGIGPADPNQEKILESFFKKYINGFFDL